ncbi:putative type III secretion chaperone SycE [Chlamydiales bacterium STE3]|nr:putative type III secretion chaperone SycE [Chlamydiales bacterium STE3]
MQLAIFIQEFLKELEISEPLPQTVPGVYTLPLDDGLSITMTANPQGFLLNAVLAEAPKKNEEHFYTEVLLANLFGQGTKGATLCLSEEGRMLTLSRDIDYDVDYKEFREILEDFINIIDFWREETLKYH